MLSAQARHNVLWVERAWRWRYPVIGYSCALRRTISYIYALASTTLDNLLREVPRREELISEYQQICLDLQAEVVALLALLDDQQPQ